MPSRFLAIIRIIPSIAAAVESAGEPISNKHRKTQRRNILCCPMMLSAWRKDAYRANWRYRAGGDGILLPEPRAGACRPELRVGTDHRSCRHTRPCSEHERQRPGQTMRIVLVVQHEVARTSTALYNEGGVRTFM